MELLFWYPWLTPVVDAMVAATRWWQSLPFN